MSDPKVDHQLQWIVADLSALQNAIREDDGSLQLLIVDYLRANFDVICLGIEAWLATDEADLTKLDAAHRELDFSASTHGFVGIATSALRIALDDPNPLLQITVDELHMLDRVLEYAKYLVDSDAAGETVAMHPVGAHIGSPTQPGSKMSSDDLDRARRRLNSIRNF